MESIKILAQDIPVYAEADVLVVGAGSAGVSAAVNAARRGVNTMIVERNFFPGGMTTGGFVTNRDYGGQHCLYGAIGGFPFEYWDRIEAEGGGRKPCPEKVGSTVPEDIHFAKLFTSGPREHVPDAMVMDPETIKYVAERFLVDSGVRVLYGQWFYQGLVENGRITGAVFVGKEGLIAVKATIVIDATGDGDVYAACGVPFEMSYKESTVNFRIGNVDEDRVVQEHLKDHTLFDRKWENLRQEFNLRHGSWRFGHIPGIANVNTNTQGKVAILDIQALTDAAVEMRTKNRKLLNWIKANIPGFENAFMMAGAPMPGCRASRRMQGLYQLNENDIYALKTFADSVMLSACFYDQKPENYPERRPKYVVAEVPYRCLIPDGLDGLLAAGRCISCTDKGLNWIRDIPFVLSSGQTAGIAASFCVSENILPRWLDVTKVQKALDEIGAPYQLSKAWAYQESKGDIHANH